MICALDVWSFRYRQGKKVEGQGHKVKWKLCTKTSNICHKRHPIVEKYPSYRKSRSSGRWQGQVFDRKLLNSRFCECAVNICLIVFSTLIISAKFCPPYRKSLSLNPMVTAVFRPEAVLTLFLRMRTKEIANHWENVGLRIFAINHSINR